MQCHTVTHILLVMGWDTMRLPCQKKSLTLCWSWDHGWDMILHGKMCHSPPVGHGMRHGQPCIRRDAAPVTHMLLGMWHDETARWKKNITHILLVFGRDMMRLLAKEKCSVTHSLLWWNCLLSKRQNVVTHHLLIMGWDMRRLPGRRKNGSGTHPLFVYRMRHGKPVWQKEKWECHSPPVGYGMRHSEPTWQKRQCNDTAHCLLVMTHETWLDSLA